VAEGEIGGRAMWAWALVAPPLIVASAFAATGNDAAARATSVSACFLAGVGLFPVVFALGRRSSWVFALAIVAATCGGVFLAARGSASADAGAAVTWVAIAFAIFAGIVSPLLALGWRAAAAAAWLALAATSCGAIYGSAASQQLLAFNPLARILWHGLRFDWLRSANMYPRFGTTFYAYPERSQGILAAVLVGMAGTVTALLIAVGKRRVVVQR